MYSPKPTTVRKLAAAFRDSSAERRPNGSLNRAGGGLVVCGRGPDGGGGKVTLGELGAVLLAMNHLSTYVVDPGGKK